MVFFLQNVYILMLTPCWAGLPPCDEAQPFQEIHASNCVYLRELSPENW